MYSLDQIIRGLETAREAQRFTATRIGDPGCQVRRDAAMVGAQLADAITILKAIWHGDREHRGWFITCRGYEWIAEKPGVDLDERHPLFLSERETRDWVDEVEDEREERERAEQDVF